MKAFPRMSHTDCFGYKHPAEDGMDLRDYFAAKAMQVLIEKSNIETCLIDTVPQAAYVWADAMMKAREQ